MAEQIMNLKVEEDVHKELKKLKLELDHKNISQTIKYLLYENEQENRE